jgi:lipopolysaccharide export system protein LptA
MIAKQLFENTSIIFIKKPFYKNLLRTIFILLLLIHGNCITFAQKTKQIEIISTNSFEFNKRSGSNAKKLIGNVGFKQDNAVMYCDSAYFYTDQNLIDAYGHIAIHQGDTLHLYGETLKYDGNTKIAQIRNKVKLIDNETTLTTDYLDFKIAEDIGFYNNGGHIINSENNLKSKTGFYFAKQKLFFFRGNVEIVNPQYTITSDTLKYNTLTRTAFFFGPTDIKSDSNYIYCENGWYNTITNISQFNKNAYLQSKQRMLKGDSLYYERENGIGKAFKNIMLIDSSRNMILTGNKSYYREKPEYALITDSAVLMNYNDKDTLYLHADTLLSTVDSSEINKIVKAFHHVKLFKPDMQGQCDSMSYTTADSTMRMFKTPVLWSSGSQITSDNIELLMANQQLNKVHFNTNCFIILQEDTDKYSQIKGKKMIGYFSNNELYKLNISGNGQSVYDAKDKDKYIGVNKAESSELNIFIANRKPSKIVFLTKPEAIFYPLDKIPADVKYLKGFKWYAKSKPISKYDIFKWIDE